MTGAMLQKLEPVLQDLKPDRVLIPTVMMPDRREPNVACRLR